MSDKLPPEKGETMLNQNVLLTTSFFFLFFFFSIDSYKMTEETKIFYKELNESNNKPVEVKPKTSKSQDDVTLRTFLTFS